jgi:glutamine---fructose-6-phosphate transaminase (isomerizing)
LRAGRLAAVKMRSTDSMTATSNLEREIASQPEAIAALLAREEPHVAAIVAQLPPFEYIVIAARGSSDHAATYAQYAWAALGGYPVALAAPSLHTLYQTPPRLHGALVVGISQSGQSPDILAVVTEGKRQGRPTLAITNDLASPLGLAADHAVELGVGAEQSIAATKTYTAELAIIALFAAAWSGAADVAAALAAVPRTLEATLEAIGATALASAGSLRDRAPAFAAMDRCVCVGRGYNLATALEVALKLKEVANVLAVPYSSADFRHGPIAVIDERAPVLLIMPSGKAFDDMAALAGDLRARGAPLLVLSDVPAALALADLPVPLPAPAADWLSPLSTVLPGQMLALRLAEVRQLDPDQPRGLRKVTRTL